MKVSYTPENGWYCESSSRLDERTASGNVTFSRNARRSVCISSGKGDARKRSTISLSLGQRMAKSCSSFSAMKRSNMSVASTTVRGTADAHSGKTPRHVLGMQQVPGEGQAARLAAQRAVADAQEEWVLPAETSRD